VRLFSVVAVVTVLSTPTALATARELERIATTPRAADSVSALAATAIHYPVDDANLLALRRLENVGADRAVRLGNPDVWRAAVRDLDAP
jgi:hypothetical protein